MSTHRTADGGGCAVTWGTMAGEGGTPWKTFGGGAPTAPPRNTWNALVGAHGAAANGVVVETSTSRKLLLTYIRLFGLWPTPHQMCSVTFDMNLLTKVMSNQNGIPEESVQQQVLTDLDEIFSNVTTLKKRC